MQAHLMTETLPNTPTNVEAKILVAALAFKVFDRESETLKNTLADVMTKALFLLIFTKKTALNVQTTKMKGEPGAKNVENTGPPAGCQTVRDTE